MHNYEPFWIFRFRENFQELVIGQKEEARKVQSLLLQVLIQSL